MDDESETTTTTAESTPTFSLRGLDQETRDILVEDKIATGG